MSILSSTIRQTASHSPRSSALRLIQLQAQARALSASSPVHAASAPNATSATPSASGTGSASRYVRKTPVPSRTASSSTSGYAKASSTYTPRSTTSTYRKPASARAPAPAPTRSSAPADTFDDYVPDDFPLPPSEPQIDDYAHLSPSSPSSAPTPQASPPLTSLPGEGYQPLPTMEGSASSQGSSLGQGQGIQDWSTSFSGLSERPFDRETAEALLKPLSPQDVEIKPDGLLYLPEIKYRRTLNAAFGPGGWGLAPRGETHVGPRIVSREWGLVCLGRLVSVARGEQEYFDPSGVPTATEACKSNALMRCCKDLGIASELWDPTFIRVFKKDHCIEVFTEHAMTKKKKKLWRKRDSPKFDYPWKEGL
ncbi:hypothetical protein IAT40_007893 [Kwoniella sp. CBS 6097]